jgi:Domain of unknown function (DUF4331)
MRRPLIAGLAGALTAGAVAVSLGTASSHREAPSIALDPTADNTDVYAFTANDRPQDLTVIANWIPFEDPAGGPNFYRFDAGARYWINIDNTGDGKPDVRYEFRFHTKVRNGKTFLYAIPPVRSLRDRNLNVVQHYDVTRYRLRGGHVRAERRIARNVPTAPNNVGPKTMPDYASLSAAAIHNLSGGGRVWAGQADDPFFVDLGSTFDAVNLRMGTGNQGGGKDDLAGYSVHSIALQVPKSEVTRDLKAVSGPAAPNAVVGVWSSTDRRRVTVLHKRGARLRRRWTQVSRLGNPLVNEVVIPLGQKDRFNHTTPDQDAKLYGKYVVTPELAHLMNVLFPGAGVPEKNRKDIVTALLTGIPGKTRISPKAVPADTLKINLGVPPTAVGQQKRFGVLAGDLGGFPNGRRLADDTTDIELRVVAGFLLGKKLPLGDGVDANDKAFRPSFPYLALPTSGLDSTLKRTQPPHAPTGAEPNE